MRVSVAIETPLQDDVRELVAELNAHLIPLTPRQFQFQMTVEQMAGDDTTVFVARSEAGRAVGCGALRIASPELAEVKRMYTRPEVRGQRLGSALLEAITELARQRRIATLMLETGEATGFEGAYRLYERSGFVRRGAFLDYPESQWSRFYEKHIGQPAVA